MRPNLKTVIGLLSLTISMQATAAQLLDLKNQQTQVLQSFSATVPALQGKSAATVKEVSRYTDVNHVTHIRMQEYYHDYPIWNANAVIHSPEAHAFNKSLPNLLAGAAEHQSMNGQLYQQLDADLNKAPNMVFDKRQADRAAAFVIDMYKSTLPNHAHIEVTKTATQLLIFMNTKNEAHWAYKVTFAVAPRAIGELPAKPVYLIDAVNFDVYQVWDDIKTIAVAADLVPGGGFGGNQQAGKLIYDGLNGHLASFMVKREAGVCYLQNDETVITHYQTKQVMQYPCAAQDPEHNHLYWSGDFDRVGDSFSPANDAIFAAQVLKEFYKIWYNVPVLVNKNGTPMVLQMNVHVAKLDNAFWDGESMTFGDGRELYPLTSLGIAAHEVSHGFTQQHSNLTYDGQSGGMNEAFSDMAAQTAEYYAHKKNSWQIGGEIFKIEGESMRYMDQPSKDCYGKEPGTFCSIDSADQYYAGLNVHYSSGVYNRAFYVLSNMPDWNPRKAFAVMLQANASYWLPQTQYADGAACVVKAAEDLDFDKKAVEQAFKTVGIRVPENCTNRAI